MTRRHADVRDMSPDLVVIVPSRGRPGRLAEMADAIAATAAGRVAVLACVDRDDPLLSGYQSLAMPGLTVITGQRKTLSGWTNTSAARVLRGDLFPLWRPRYLASLGDDHLPRTPGWDRLLADAIEATGGPGFGYGDDRLQGERLPTAWVVSAAIVEALGWMMLPCCEHMYVDTAVGDLGRAADALAYLPDVVIEHMHPAAGKADRDDGYRRVNRPAQYRRDRAAYRTWLAGGLAADAATVRALRKEHHGTTTEARGDVRDPV
jgi:hypothetical protein